MSSSRTEQPWARRGVLAALAAVPACGFTPVYGPSGAAHGLSGQFLVDDPVDEPGYLLVRRLEERLGRPADARYRLAASVTITERNLGLTDQAVVAREQLIGTVSYSVIDQASGERLRTGSLRNFTSYSSPLVDPDNPPRPGDPYVGSYVSIREARRDAGERLMVILADSIVADLLATAPAWRR